MLLAAFWEIAKKAPRHPLSHIAPLVRRPVSIAVDGAYPELGIRSFGNGTFHKPALTGFELGAKRIFHIHPGDLLFSNVFAWEGAIAVARSQDAGRFGSHRYITCLPDPAQATATFLCFYFLTEEGLGLVRAASPGGAGRNRTLGLDALQNLSVPVPPIADQTHFDTLLAEVETLKGLQAATATELDALLAAILHKAFKGEL